MKNKKEGKGKKYVLTLDEHEAYVVSRACEFYLRVYLGQFSEISHELLLMQHDEIHDWCERRDNAETYLYKAREYIYPELHGKGHSYGVGKFEVADTAYNVHQVLRHALYDERKPYALFGTKLPGIEVKEAESNADS